MHSPSGRNKKHAHYQFLNIHGLGKVIIAITT